MEYHQRRITLGKHTGRASIKSKLDALHLDVTSKQFENIFKQVKTLGDKGICVSDEDLKSIVITELATTGKEYIKLLGLNVMTGESVSATATVRLSIEVIF